MIKNIFRIFGIVIFSVCKLLLSLVLIVLKCLFIFAISVRHERSW